MTTDRKIKIDVNPHKDNKDVFCNVILNNKESTHILGLTFGEAEKLQKLLFVKVLRRKKEMR